MATTLPTTGRARTTTSNYDALYQLTQVTHGGRTTESYLHAAVGNRLSSLGVPSYSYNPSNEQTSVPGASYIYDNNGNLVSKATSAGTTQYVWDFENRSVSKAIRQLPLFDPNNQ